MRALWRDAPATYKGKYVSFERVHCDVKCAQAGGVPVIIGGSTEFAARRTGRLGDGFFPYVISPEDFVARVELLRATAQEHGRDPDAIELTVWPGSFDFARTFDLGLVRAYVDAGVTRLVISGMESGSDDLDAMRDLIRRYRDEIIAKL
jgi:alkanesulfonate monooxygenase SsuD/methylene tetrahydromethanopterin reductase-like flavin-dependent oxidoreductase (luciferase family)